MSIDKLCEELRQGAIELPPLTPEQLSEKEAEELLNNLRHCIKLEVLSKDGGRYVDGWFLPVYVHCVLHTPARVMSVVFIISKETVRLPWWKRMLGFGSTKEVIEISATSHFYPNLRKKFVGKIADEIMLRLGVELD